MAPTISTVTRKNGVARVRARLLSALHMGRLRPGDRVLSVRRLADQTGMNHKTVHRAYTALAREGILEVRPGSGTFVTERRSIVPGLPPTPGLLGAVDHCRDEATRLGLSPSALLRFLSICLEDGLRGVAVGLVECNLEQISMIGRDLQSALGIQVRPILLGDLERDATRALGTVGRVVTTDCHYSQVAELVEPHGVPTYTVALDQRFPRVVLQVARRSELVMVVRDRRFGRVFTKLLRQLESDDSVLRRIRFVSDRDALPALRSIKPEAWAYSSPLIPSALLRSLPRHVRRIEECWHVEPKALESVRAGLALEQALGSDLK